MQIVVELSWPEVMFACDAGVMRRISAIRGKRTGCYGATDEDTWGHDINGAIAELAVAKWRNVFWSGTIGRVDLPDVGQLQVRSKIRPDDRLVIRPTDNDDKIFVSVRVDTPNCYLCGWLRGHEGKAERWLVSVNRPPMYFVPDAFLHPMAELSLR